MTSIRWTGMGRLLVAMGVLVLVSAACGGGGDHDEGRADDSPTTQSPTTQSPTSEAPTTSRGGSGPAGTGSIVTAGEVTPATSGEDPALALCLGAAPVAPAPTVGSPTLAEISGLVASRSHDGVLWAIDDSGGAAAISAIQGADGADLGTWMLVGATNLDWEDLAIGPVPDADTSLLYVADIGDNLRSRADVRVYRVAEPDPAGGSGGGEIAEVDTIVLTYPDGAQDAESLFVDPVSGDLVIVTKNWDGGPAGIYRAPGDFADGTAAVLDAVGSVDLRAFGQLATGADISADGSIIALRTYGSVLLWWRQDGTTVAEAMAGGPCEAPSVNEAQGETVAIESDVGGYVTVSEGMNPPINVFRR